MQEIQLQQGDSLVIRKIQDLCQAILDQPGYARMRGAVTAFLEDAEAFGQYQRLCDLQDQLHVKETEGQPISDQEWEEFGRAEEQFLLRPEAKDFVAAQRSMQEVELTVNRYVRKTMETGRVPTEADFEQGSCGPGCGCH